MTQFEQALQQSRQGELQTPFVSTPNGQVDYFGYQLSVHIYYVSLLTKRIKSRNFSLKDAKEYYGLKSRTAIGCLEELKKIRDTYNLSF